MLKQIENSDWQQAFGYAGEPGTCIAGFPNVETVRFGKSCETTLFTREDVKSIKGISEGEGEGPNWIIWGQLKDGRWFFLIAGCDYTGWDCQSSGKAIVAKTRHSLLKYALDNDSRERFGLPIEK